MQFVVRNSGRVNILKDYGSTINHTKEELENILNTIQESICVIDKDLIIKNFNEAFETTIQLPGGEIIGRKCYEVIHNYSKKDYKKHCYSKCIVKKAFLQKIAVESVHHHVNKDGSISSITYHHSKAIPQKDGNHVVYINNDITPQKQAESALSKSEKKYRTFFYHDITGDFISTPTGKLIDCNPAFLKIFGFRSFERAKSKKIEKLYTLPAKFQEIVTMINAEKSIVNYEHEMQKVDGEKIFVNQNIVGEFDENNRLINIRGYIIDITERKQAEEALRDSEEKYKGLVNNSIVGIYQTTMNGKILTSNPKLVQIFGFRNEDEFKKTKPHKLFKDEEKRKELLTILEEKGRVNNFEMEARRKDGNTIILNISAKVYNNHGGTSKYIEGIIQDVTEQKILERRLKDYTAQLEHSNQLKDLFTDIMRHDLLNPLNVIQNMAEIINETDDFSQIHDGLKMINRNATKLQEMIDTAAMLAQIESMEKLNFKRRELGTIMSEVIENVESIAEEKNQKIENKIKGEHIAYVSLFIEAVFLNLLTNAIKYSPENSKIIVNINGHNSNWRITVKDSGEGIPDKFKESIFSRFKRRDRKGVKGTGLGLAIVKRILELHEGRVWVEDNPKGGSIFCVDIPKENISEKRKGKDSFTETITAQ